MTAFVYGGVAKYVNSTGLSLTTTNQAVLTTYVPANTLVAGSSFRISWNASSSSTTATVTPSLWYGTTGVISGGTPDPKVWAGVATASSSASGHDISVDLTCNTPGSSGTAWSTSYVYCANTAGTASAGVFSVFVPSAANTLTGAPNTTINNILTLALVSSTTITYKVWNMTIESLY